MAERKLVEVKEDFIPWNEPGTNIAGDLGPREKIPIGTDGQWSWRRQIRTEEGEIKSFLSPDWSLESKLTKIPEGTWVEIEYLGETPTGSGNMKKNFKVLHQLIEVEEGT